MPGAKVLAVSRVSSGATVYAVVRRLSDNFLLNDADGSFAAAPADPYLALAEVALEKGVYSVSESRTAWLDGEYRATFYKQVGGSPSPTADAPAIESQTLVCWGDVFFTPLTTVKVLTYLQASAARLKLAQETAGKTLAALEKEASVAANYITHIERKSRS